MAEDDNLENIKEQEDGVGFSYSVANQLKSHRNGNHVAMETEKCIRSSSCRSGLEWRKCLVEFCRTTTLHGVRNIAEADSLARRFMWIAVVFACIGGVGYQIVDRIMYFARLPVNVNVEINYNQSLTFPALTICNQNAFKASEATKHGYFRMIEDIYSDTGKFSSEDLEKYGANNITLEQLYMPLQHRLEDFLVKCQWNSHACDQSDFEVIPTDHGVCYRFKKNESRLLISSSGVDSGLRLTLNVEQYEYMTGPHDAAGVKILLHDSNEFPAVHSLGQAIPTGSHAFIGVKYLLINNLKEPYGKCNNRKLAHTDYYTADECFRDCMTKMVAKRCGCRDIHMPSINGYPPVCTLEDYYGCFKPFLAEFQASLKEQCVCPVPCVFSIYDSSLSYATISNHVVSKLLSSKESHQLRTKLLTASEVTSRMDRDKFRHIQGLVNNLKNQYSVIQFIVNKLSSSIDAQLANAKRLFNEMKHVFLTKERLYRFQEYIIQNNFLRGREAMEERTLQNLVVAYAEIAMKTRRRIRRLASFLPEMVNERQECYNLIEDDIATRRELSVMAKENISVLLNAFYNGTKIFNYKFENISRMHTPYVIPKPLLNYSMHHNWYVEKYCPKMLTDMDMYYNATELFLDLAQLAFEDQTVNETDLNYVFERFQFCCRTFMFSKSVCYSQGIELPKRILRERYSKFDTVWNNYNVQANDVLQNMNGLSKSMQLIKNVTLPLFDSVMSQASLFITDNTTSLIDLSSVYVSEEAFNNTRDLRAFFQEISTRGQGIHDGWTLLIQPAIQLWTTVIDDEDLVEYYEFANYTEFLRNLSDVINEVTASYSNARDANDVRNDVQTSDVDFFDALADLSSFLAGYKASIKIDGDFVRDNFLQLDVFYRQLSYEQIDQQIAYDFFALICDIGGSLGLFIGASMLTMVEIIDLLFTQTSVFTAKNKKATYS